MKEFKPGLPKRFTTHIGFGFTLTKHFPPGDYLAFKLKFFQLLGKNIPVGNMQLGSHVTFEV
jgi:hypothetical protein